LRGCNLLELSKEELRSGFWKIVSRFLGLPLMSLLCCS
jgi:hypothetical protein